MTKKLLGDQAPTPGEYQVPQLNVAKVASPPIQTSRWFRNGKFPDASAMNQLCEQMNQAIAFRTRELFSILGDLGSAPGIQATSTAGTRNRWRGAFHTGPLSHAVLVHVVLFPPSSNYGNDTYAKLKIYSDATESTLVSTTEFHYGPGPSTSSVGGWQYHKLITKIVTGLDPNTTYYCVFSDETYGRLQSACIADLQSVGGEGGYLPTNFTETTPILDVYRENLVANMPALLKRGGSKVFQWTVNIQSSPSTNNTTTYKNILDATTSVATSSAGWTLDMRYKNRLSQTAVPCRMAICGSFSGVGTSGEVKLVDSSGTTVASYTSGWTGTTPKWNLIDVNLDPSVDKYDIHARLSGGTAGTLSIYAVSCWQHED